MPATCWKMLVRTGFKSPWGRISVAVLVAYLTMLSLWLACQGIKWTDTTYHSLGMHQRHECYRLGNDCKQFKLSHKPSVAGLNCRGGQYNCNFTFYLLTSTSVLSTNDHLSSDRILQSIWQELVNWNWGHCITTNRVACSPVIVMPIKQHDRKRLQ